MDAKKLIDEWQKRDVYSREHEVVATKKGFLHATPGGFELEWDGETFVMRYGLKPNYNAPLKDTPKLRELLAKETKDQSKLLKKCTIDAMVLSKRHLQIEGAKPVLELVLWRAIEPESLDDLKEQLRLMMTAAKSWSKKRQAEFLKAL